MSTQAAGEGLASPFGPGEDATALEREIWENLDGIPDPHIPVSLVEMAMIYDVEVDRGPAGAAVTVEMTFPCMGCPAYDMIIDDIEACLRTVQEVQAVGVDVVWDPVWSKEMLSERVREKITESGIGL
ncbi:MAG: metal-sulfur cluster assembly factor [Salinirussus sp.]